MASHRMTVVAAHVAPPSMEPDSLSCCVASAEHGSFAGEARHGCVALAPDGPRHRVAIHYADGPGRGEVTRMLLAVGGVPYDDFRYPPSVFAKLTSTDAQASDPTKGSPFPFNQMPALEVDGCMYAQTSSIARFAAKLAGLQPEDAVEALKADEIFEHTAEIQSSTTPLLMTGIPGRAGVTLKPRAEREAAFQVWSRDRLPVMMKQLERLLEPSGYFVGGWLTWADIAVFNRLENLDQFAKSYGVEVLTKYPMLQAHSRLVAAVPAVAAYLDARAALMAAHDTASKSAGTYGKAGKYRCESSGWRTPPPYSCTIRLIELAPALGNSDATK